MMDRRGDVPREDWVDRLGGVARDGGRWEMGDPLFIGSWAALGEERDRHRGEEHIWTGRLGIGIGIGIGISNLRFREVVDLSLMGGGSSDEGWILTLLRWIDGIDKGVSGGRGSTRRIGASYILTSLLAYRWSS
jgi:hypothetical protein